MALRNSRKGSVLFLVIAVGLALAAAVAAVGVVRSFSETAPVVVAVKDIPPYTMVKKDDLKVANVPRVSIPKDAVFKVQEVEGRYFRAPVLANEVVRKGRIADVRGDRGLMSARLTELGRKDLRAFALPYDSVSAVGGEIRDGDRVDIVASVKIDAGGQQVGVGKIVARNVLVLKATKGGGEEKGALIVALTPSQIEDIAFALTSGQLRFALNPYETDETAAETKGVTGRAWLEKYGFYGPPAKSTTPR